MRVPQTQEPGAGRNSPLTSAVAAPPLPLSLLPSLPGVLADSSPDGRGRNVTSVHGLFARLPLLYHSCMFISSPGRCPLAEHSFIWVRWSGEHLGKGSMASVCGTCMCVYVYPPYHLIPSPSPRCCVLSSLCGPWRAVLRMTSVAELTVAQPVT